MCSNYCTLSDVCGAFYVQGRHSIASCKDPMANCVSWNMLYNVESTYLCMYENPTPDPKICFLVLASLPSSYWFPKEYIQASSKGSRCHKIHVSDKLKTTSTSIYLQPPNYFVKVVKLQLLLIMIINHHYHLTLTTKLFCKGVGRGHSSKGESASFFFLATFL